MLIIVPPSETKRRAPDHGPPVALGQLAFPALGPTRAAVLDALLATSARADAFDRLLVRPSLADEVARNTWLLELPARPVLDVYAGPLHGGLDAARLSPEAADRAARSLVVVSALWGALRPADRIPPYRLHICSRLVGIARLEPTWRAVLPDVLAEAAAPEGIVLDLRSPGFQLVGMPAGPRDRIVSLRVDQHGVAGSRIGDVVAKRVRGEAARHLLESGAEPDEPAALAEILGDRWPVRLVPPQGPARTWTMTLSVAA
jgi:uncharacterized protein